jgi:sulfur relay (sulfurtransferase) complex TusBCD TusD component (DsrE family)
MSERAEIPVEVKRLGIVLYTSPTTSQFRFGLSLARGALAKGYGVHLFAWGDSVYGLARSGIGDYFHASNEFKELLTLDGFTLDVCTSCCKQRGLSSDDLISGAHLSGTHKIPEMVKNCHKTLVMIP